MAIPKQKVAKLSAYDVTLTADNGGTLTLHLDDNALYTQAKIWTYASTNWQVKQSEPFRITVQKGIDTLAGFATNADGVAGVQAALEEIGEASVVEVTIPFSSENLGWGARTFPWESVLTLATRHARGGRRLTVVRHLDVQGRPTSADSPTSVLTVASGPGDIGSKFSFDYECDIVRRAVSLKSSHLKDPDAETLRRTVAAKKPSVVHLAGVDSRYLNETPVRDGFVLTASSKPSTSDAVSDPSQSDSQHVHGVVDADELAEILTADGADPTLITFATCFSAARMAPLAVAKGARSAIGLSGYTDDATCNMFFSQFYSLWKSRDWRLLTSFCESLNWLKDQPLSRHSSGLVLWSDRSLLSELKTPIPTTSASDESAVDFGVPTLTLADPETPMVGSVTGDGSVPSPKFFGDPPPIQPLAPYIPVSAAFSVSVRPVQTLNYSLLHNSYSIRTTETKDGRLTDDTLTPLFTPYFSEFLVRRTSLQDNRPLDVKVRLNVGEGECSCSFRAEWEEADLSIKDLRPLVSLPLLANLQRQTFESLNTIWEVEVSCQREIVYHRTHPVRLLPADEWRDSERVEESAWLPSFTLPRDPSVLTVIQKALRYLRTILDNADAGFDGYQRVAEDVHTAAVVVDPQVRSLWAALLHDLPLAYINPPPTYSESSQRLRTPGMVIEGGNATCIDLALLLASCLEFVGISPVIFLIHGHAFPGYWRNDQWAEDLLQQPAANDPDPAVVEAEPDAAPGRPRGFPWVYDDRRYEQIMSAVEEGKLVPLESTFVTQGRSFQDALIQGFDLVSEMAVFDAMIDIQIAREFHVTPLPILQNTN